VRVRGSNALNGTEAGINEKLKKSRVLVDTKDIVDTLAGGHRNLKSLILLDTSGRQRQLAGWLAVWLAWLAGRPGWLAGWLAGCLASWLAGWPHGCLVAWLSGWLAAWLAAWLAGWLPGARNC